MRFYKEGTYLVRFFVELIIISIALHILYLLSIALFNHEFSWIEMITLLFGIIVISALMTNPTMSHRDFSFSSKEGVLLTTYLLGIDIGTYESKGVITTDDGTIAGTHAIPHALDIPKQGWAEHDAERVWWTDMCLTIRTLLGKTAVRPGEIAAVGCSAVVPDVLPVDRDGNPLRRAAFYMESTLARWKKSGSSRMKSVKKSFIPRAEMRCPPQSDGPKIRWLKRHEPEIYRISYYRRLTYE